MLCNLLLGLPPCWRCALPHGHRGKHFRLSAWEPARRLDDPSPFPSPPLLEARP